MRIIAGEKRSRKLLAPEGNDTRPTADRVKEALFSILLSRLPGARVLDLYAGSGALSLEALSRGASSAVLADQSQKACRIIQQNIDALDYGKQARLLKMSDSAALNLLEKEKTEFDLIFLDPPYRMDMSGVCERLCESGLMAEEGIIVVEHGKETPPHPGKKVILFDHREYGITGLSFFIREETKEEQ